MLGISAQDTRLNRSMDEVPLRKDSEIRIPDHESDAKSRNSAAVVSGGRVSAARTNQSDGHGFRLPYVSTRPWLSASILLVLVMASTYLPRLAINTDSIIDISKTDAPGGVSGLNDVHVPTEPAIKRKVAPMPSHDSVLGGDAKAQPSSAEGLEQLHGRLEPPARNFGAQRKGVHVNSVSEFHAGDGVDMKSSTSSTVLNTSSPRPSDTRSTANDNELGDLPAVDRARKWLANQNPEHFTVKLFSFGRMENAQRFLGQYPDLVLGVQVVPGDQPIFRVVYGSFESRSRAEEAFLQLPPRIQSEVGKPVIRVIRRLQQD